MRYNTFDNLLRFLNNLQEAQLSYTLAHHRDEAVMIAVAVPGERWEIEFLDDGSVEVERFISNGEISAEEALNELLTIYAEQEPNGQGSRQNADLITVYG